MKPSESHKQPTFAIPKNLFQEVDSVSATRIVCVVITVEEIRAPSCVYCAGPLCSHSCLENKWITTAERYFISAGICVSTKVPAELITLTSHTQDIHKCKRVCPAAGSGRYKALESVFPRLLDTSFSRDQHLTDEKRNDSTEICGMYQI